MLKHVLVMLLLAPRALVWGASDEATPGNGLEADNPTQLVVVVEEMSEEARNIGLTRQRIATAKSARRHLSDTEKTHTLDQSIASVSTTGKWSLTPWMEIGLQERIRAPRTRKPSKHASG
jgi:hypothetical protein